MCAGLYFLRTHWPNSKRIVYQLKGSTVSEYLSYGTHSKQDRQEVDSQENITLLKRKDNSY